MLDQEQLDRIQYIKNSGSQKQLVLLVEYLCQYANGLLTEAEFNTLIAEMDFDITHGSWLDRYSQ